MNHSLQYFEASPIKVPQQRSIGGRSLPARFGDLPYPGMTDMAFGIADTRPVADEPYRTSLLRCRPADREVDVRMVNSHADWCFFDISMGFRGACNVGKVWDLAAPRVSLTGAWS